MQSDAEEKNELKLATQKELTKRTQQEKATPATKEKLAKAAYNKMANRWHEIRNAAEEERIQDWRDKQAKNNASFSYAASEADENKQVSIIAEFKDKSLSKERKMELRNAALCAATGSASSSFAHLLINQTMGAFVITENGYSKASEVANALNEGLIALNPKDEIEGMLCSKILVMQDQTMHCIKRANTATDSRIIDSNVNRAIKFGRLQNETIQTLLKYRRKGEQSVVVQHQHINVGHGGQAIGVHAGGAGDNKKN